MVIAKKSWDRDEYEARQRAVLALIPHPFGTPFWLKDEVTVDEKPKKRRKTTRKKSSRKKPPKRKSGARGLLDLVDDPTSD